MNVFVLLSILSVIALIMLPLFLLKRKGKTQWMIHGLAVILGVALALLVKVFFKENTALLSFSGVVVRVFSDNYMHILQFMAIPTLVFGLSQGIIQSAESKRTGKSILVIGGTVLVTTAVSAIIGYLLTVFFQLKLSALPHTAAVETQAKTLSKLMKGYSAESLTESFTNFLPTNIETFFQSLGERGIFISIVLTLLALASCKRLTRNAVGRESMKGVEGGIRMLSKLIEGISTSLLSVFPYLLPYLVASFLLFLPFSALKGLLPFILVFHVGAALVLICNLALLYSVGVEPLEYLKKALFPLVLSFLTDSTMATYAANVKTQTEKFSVDTRIAHLSGGMGLFMGQNGCGGLFPAMVVTMIALDRGVEVTSLSYFFMLTAMILLSSLFSIYWGGGATTVTLGVLFLFGNLPVESFALLVTASLFVQATRTLLNENGALTAGIYTDRKLKQLK
ncbi:MAG: cation:dicarboxylase symporter family transporter [Streptococcaceae bacterium]|jgi:L-cystine uptake protein TcyP (sodium:dicarboxylate symporter family)|nr:cation:dicarboxylase symporter family transporter [Streptococcaceae bacterium]